MGLAVFLLGMNKGGLPVASVALPILILIWPDQSVAARSAVAFVLPLLCVMDVVAILFYRRHIQWALLLPLLPGTIAGVAVATLFFVSEHGALIAISDRGLKLMIGILGLVFVSYRAAQKWILHRLALAPPPHLAQATAYGLTAGVTSTLAHAAGPVMQMYLLSRKLDRLQFAGTNAGFFFILNLLKILPFAMLGRFHLSDLKLGATMIPLIPFGVALGYTLVRLMKTKHYIGFIYVVLFITSVTLILKAIG